jgi:hypothetical protein
MTRRQFLSIAAVAGVAPAPIPGTVSLPVHLLLDSQARWLPGQVAWFHSSLWPQAAGDLMRSGIRLECTQGEGGVWRPPHREPVITGLERAAVNLVVTREIPAQWDRGSALCGLATRYRGYHLCMIALNHAHGHQVPFLSVNTCLHELLHVVLQDIFAPSPSVLTAQAREFRIDFHATCLWLFRDGALRQSAQAYLARLQSDAGR